MRRLTSWPLAAALTGGWLALAAVTIPAGEPTLADGGAGAASPLSSGTPIVDPIETSTPGPEPRPIHMPAVVKNYDPLAPGPLPATALGHVAKLNEAGRAACAPATHVLLEEPEGTVDAKVEALLYRHPGAEGINLDFYIGEHVAASGLASMAPDACRHLTWLILAVKEVEIREEPPG